MFTRLRSDIQCILDRDPAARSTWEVITCYPGLHALVLHRLAHWFWAHGLRWLGRFISQFCALADRHRDPSRARRSADAVFIDHGMGVVIGETAEIGDGCTIYQGVTLGGTSLTKGAKRHPTLGRDVVVGAGAKVLGGFTVGDGASIGSQRGGDQAGAGRRHGGGHPGAHHPGRGRHAARGQVRRPDGLLGLRHHARATTRCRRR